MRKENSKRRKPKGKPPGAITIYLPQGARPSDKFEASTIPDTSLSDIGVQPGDVAIIYRTSRIQSGDLIACEVSGKKACIGKYRPASDGTVHLEPLNDEYEATIFSADKMKVLGRVVRFDRDGRAIQIEMELRPVRPAKNKPDITPVNQVEWQRACQNKWNARLIERLAQIKSEQPEERQAVVIAALHLWQKAAQVPKTFKDSDLFTPEAIYTLDYHTRLLGNGYEMPAAPAHGARQGVVETITAILKGKPISAAEKIAPRIIKHDTDWANYRAAIPLGQRKNCDLEDWLAGQAPQPADPREQQIRELEYRLTRLEEEGDITNSTQCFQLERKIYDLRREIARDEWPEVIGDE
ncbi:MAG TPA: S24 family peptidase [Pyrinomonadaceae bacterium]